jgi:hypothetical protein
MSPNPGDEVQRVFDGEQHRAQEEDCPCGFEWDHEFSGDTLNLSRKRGWRKITDGGYGWDYAG